MLLLDDEAVLAIVVEVQLAPDDDKRWTWPVYLATLRARLRCPTVLLVVPVDEATAKWASKPIELGAPGFVLRPFVLAPSAVPIVTDAAVAREMPELALLSAIAHGHDEASDVAVSVGKAAIEAAGQLDEDRARIYADLVLTRVGPAAKRALEAWMMEAGKYEYQSDFAKKYIAVGEAEGEAKGKAKGKAEGKAEGEAEGKAKAVLAVLAARGLAASDTQRTRVLVERNLAVLDRWITRAVTCASTDEALSDKP